MKMATVRILIVEDEPLIAEDLQATLEDLGYAVCGRVHRSRDALTAIVAERPDLVLLDIQLGDGPDGVELAETLSARARIPFIYVTSHSDKGTLDRVKRTCPAGFIIKPFDDDDLHTQIEIGLARHAASLDAGVQPAEAQRSDFVIADSIFVRDKGRLVKVPLDDIHYAEADDNYTTLYTATRRYVITSTLTAMEEKLGSPHLLRVHRSYAVDLRKITAVEEGQVRVGSISIPVGRTHREELMARIRTL